MKLSVSLAALATVAGVAASSAVLLPSANAKTVTHTATFTSVTQQNITFSQLAGGSVDKDVTKAGKLFGWDLVRVTVDPKTHKVSGAVTLETASGYMYGTFTPGSGSTTHGAVTGGTGSFKGTTGTILIKDLNKSGSKSAVTLTWHN